MNAAGSGVRLGEVRGFIGGLSGAGLHAKRVDALAVATLGVVTGRVALSGINRIGAGAGSGAGNQACGQASGPAYEQRG